MEIDRATPRSMVSVDDIWAKLAGVIADGAEVVIDHVEQDREAFLMRGVDEPLEGIGAPVGLVYGEQRDTVVTPSAVAGKGRERHEFDVSYTQRYQMIEPGYG